MELFQSENILESSFAHPEQQVFRRQVDERILLLKYDLYLPEMSII